MDKYIENPIEIDYKCRNRCQKFMKDVRMALKDRNLIQTLVASSTLRFSLNINVLQYTEALIFPDYPTLIVSRGTDWVYYNDFMVRNKKTSLLSCIGGHLEPYTNAVFEDRSPEQNNTLDEIIKRDTNMETKTYMADNVIVCLNKTYDPDNDTAHRRKHMDVFVKLYRLLIEEKEKKYNIKYPEEFKKTLKYMSEQKYELANAMFLELDVIKRLNDVKFINIVNLFKKEKNARIYSLNKKAQQTQNRISQTTTNLQKLYNEYKTIVKDLNIAISVKDKEEIIDPNDLRDYIQNHPYIQGAVVHESTFDLVYRTPFKYYDKDVILRLCENTEGDSKTILKLFLYNKRFLINIYTAVNFCPAEGVIRVGDRDELPEELQRSRFEIRHPHIMRFGCFGNFEDILRDLATCIDPIVVIEQITGAVLNINFLDTPVVSYLIDNIKDIFEEKPDAEIIYDTEKEKYVDLEEAEMIIEEIEEHGTDND